MLDREQLAEALSRLDPRDREILDYSLRRRVPDPDLAEIFGGDAGEVARLRAAAVERLSNDLGVQRGGDLGHMLKELLEPATWELLPAPPPPSGPAGGHPPVGVADASLRDREEQRRAQPEPEPRPELEPTGPERAPVLGMLDRSPPRAQDAAPSGRRKGRGPLIALGAGLAVLVPAGMVAALSLGDDSQTRKAVNGGGTRTFEPKTQVIGDPFPSDPQSVNRYPVAYVRRRTVLYDRPAGREKVRIPAKTDWDSPRVLGVVKREGEWLGVVVPELENGEVGWLRDRTVAKLTTVSWSLHVDLSRRTLTVRRDGKKVRRMKIGVGRKNHSTPTGRFAVTDKLRVNDPSSPYGCCVLALSGHQTRLPAGWPGGDRLALHATSDTKGLGRAVSLGCMRTRTRDARWLMNTIPLGAPVFVRE